MLHKARRNHPAQEPLDDEERELMDPESWDWDSVEDGVTVGEPGTLLTLRFSRDEHRLLAEAASSEGLTTHEYIKRSALLSARANSPDLVDGGLNHQSRARRSG
jgi:hypothetical protein